MPGKDYETIEPVYKKYLIFAAVKYKGKKTLDVDVYTRDQTTILARIKWYPHWRKYVLYTSDDVILDVLCLKEITDYIENLMLEKKLEERLKKYDS